MLRLTIIYIEKSPRYSQESNGIAGSFMYELGLREIVFFKNSVHQEILWAEYMAHGNWLRNISTSPRVLGEISVTHWKSNTRL